MFFKPNCLKVNTNTKNKEINIPNLEYNIVHNL